MAYLWPLKFKMCASVINAANLELTKVGTIRVQVLPLQISPVRFMSYGTEEFSEYFYDSLNCQQLLDFTTLYLLFYVI